MRGISRNHHTIIPVFILAAAVTINACALFQKPVTGMAVLLPRDTDVPGWERTDYGVATGLEGVDRPRESYTDYNVKERALGRYRSYRTGGDLSVEIVRCSSVLDSFGIFSLERSRSADPRNVDETAVISGGSLFSWKGKYYIHIEAPAVEGNHRDDLVAFLASVRQNLKPLGAEETLPSYTVLFSTDFTLNGLVFLRKERDEIPIRDIYVRTRIIMEKEYLVFFHRAQSDQEADSTFNGLVSKMGGFILSRADRYPLAFRDKGDGAVVNVSRYGPWIFGVLNASSREEGVTIMKMLNREIRDFR